MYWYKKDIELIDLIFGRYWELYQEQLSSFQETIISKERRTGYKESWIKVQQYMCLLILLYLFVLGLKPISYLENYIKCFECKQINIYPLIDGLSDIYQSRQIGGDTIGEDVMVYEETKLIYNKTDILALLDLPKTCNYYCD